MDAKEEYADKVKTISTKEKDTTIKCGSTAQAVRAKMFMVMAAKAATGLSLSTLLAWDYTALWTVITGVIGDTIANDPMQDVWIDYLAYIVQVEGMKEAELMKHNIELPLFGKTLTMKKLRERPISGDADELLSLNRWAAAVVLGHKGDFRKLQQRDRIKVWEEAERDLAAKEDETYLRFALSAKEFNSWKRKKAKKGSRDNVEEGGEAAEGEDGNE